ncbi:MAG TPA: polysaccharide deacetylase family protein [Chloroflexota bacterium]
MAVSTAKPAAAAARPTSTSTPAVAATARATGAPTVLATPRTATPIATGPTVPATPRATAAAPTPTVAATTVSAVATRPPVTSSGAAGSLALTFDAGSDRGYAQDILDTLAEERVVASFGITGVWAKANSDLVRRMAADGHLVFNHTLDHRSFTGVSDKLGGLSPSRRRQELDDADAIIAPLVGSSLKPYYRLPYGDDDARVAADVLPAGYSRKVGWTVDSLGWRGASAADIVARCLKLAAPGGVYVFHVGRASQDSLALPQLIHGLRERGYGFVKVDQTV